MAETPVGEDARMEDYTQFEYNNEPMKILRESLDLSIVDNLSFFQRLLLITDGTVTQILEEYVQEPIDIVTKKNTIHQAPEKLSILNMDEGCEVLERTVLLRGTITMKNWLYAKSSIVPDRLSEEVIRELKEGRGGIGYILKKHRVETFREIISFGLEPAKHISAYFNISRMAPLIYRVYRIYASNRPIMCITEKFPRCFYI